jgi:hypothetical protein
MNKLVIHLLPLLSVAILVTAACSGSSGPTAHKSQYRPCPQFNLRVPCVRLPSGELVRM